MTFSPTDDLSTQTGHSIRVINVVNHVLTETVLRTYAATLLLHTGHLTLSHNQPKAAIPKITKDKLRTISSGISKEVAWLLFTRHTNRANKNRRSTIKNKNTHTFQLCFVSTSQEEFMVFCFPIPFLNPSWHSIAEHTIWQQEIPFLLLSAAQVKSC